MTSFSLMSKNPDTIRFPPGLRYKVISFARSKITLLDIFATIISSIYCFEVVHCLFLQIVDNIKDYLQDLYYRIRDAF